MDEPPKDYEMMLQKYEAEVRNHIKIEQQLKLHIECLQDKLEEAEKERQRENREREARKADEESQAVRESKRYRELLNLREEEVDKLKAELSRLTDSAEELRGQVEQMERDNRALKASNRVVPKGMVSNNSVQVAP